MTRIKITTAVILGVCMVLASGPSHAETYSVRYWASGGWQASRNSRVLVLPTPTPTRLALLGGFEFTPSDTSLEVTIADDLAPGGSFLFNMCQVNEENEDVDYGCGFGEDDVTTGDICYTGPTRLEGLTPMNPVGIIIFSATDPCPDAPTTGIVTVVG